MLVGLDVGGTFTDATLIDSSLWRQGAEPGTAVLKAVKAPTRPGNVLPGLLEALAEVLDGVDAALVRRVCVSSTLGLNALLTGHEDPTGILSVPGPGIDPRIFWGDDQFLHILSGAEDHRGSIVAPVNPEEVRTALSTLLSDGAVALAVVSKFSPKNPEMEYQLRTLAQGVFGEDAPIVCGSDTGGTLNFPRRMQTAYCNASLLRIAREFASSLESAVAQMGLQCPLVILKADAGVFSNEEAAQEPACCMGSGPAASLMGVLALVSPHEQSDLLMIDIGGTTTDLALLAGGQPLLAKEGLTLGGRSTLIRSLWTRSISLGGDSPLSLEQVDDHPDGMSFKVHIGQGRLGPALALCPEDVGKRPATLTDALNILGKCTLGDVEASLQGLRLLAEAAGVKDDLSVVADAFAQAALKRIQEEADRLLADVNGQPVYTIRELLVEKAIRPGAAVFIGGPAEALAPCAEAAWGLRTIVPVFSRCVNAVGAALARPTRMADLYADTLRGRMSMTSLGIEKAIDRQYTLDTARADIIAALAGVEKDIADDTIEPPLPQIVFAESFQVLDDTYGRGRIIKVRAQLAAGLAVER